MKMVNKLRLQLIDLLSRTSIFDTLETLRHEQYLPEEKLNSIRQKKLDLLFETARTSTAYYAQFDSYDEVPELTKQIMRQRPDDFLSSAYKGKLVKKFTGGTTGTALMYYTSALSQSNLWAGLILSWESTGYQFGDRVAFIAGSALLKTDTKHKIFYKLLNTDKYPAAALDDALISKYLDHLRKRQTRLIYGYAMSVNIIADYILRNDLPPIEGLKGIVCTSEVLTDKMRLNIEKAFKVKVYNQYGCNEAGISAFECPHGSMHLISSRCVYESNEEGILVGTDLTNDAYPFLKYNSGDLVEFADGKCSCGRTYPIISNIAGRGNEMLVDQQNKKIHSVYFNFMFKNDPSIKQHQVVFDERSVCLNIQVDENFTEKSKEHYLEIMKNNFVFDHYEIRINEKFQAVKNLKHTFIIDKRKKLETVNS